ncbi:dTDP-4-dehydrorhamnose 3,5-epimerase [Hyphomicrobium sp.]|jgi:dTDP-4-dehydrorhamnose 3,5-epimerase|uniref:dTDP-4-dehydrorhamnose 3,5-epimerase n=1 Tax=Hyphomicrobium sp. TaxID=82 RepID=UPI003561BA1D
MLGQVECISYVNIELSDNFVTQITRLDIPDVLLLATKRYPDTRGYFTELYNAKTLAEAGIDDKFVQDNLSLSAMSGTIRGLHFQVPPYAQSKLVRVSSGRILDVAVDIRPASSTYGRHVAVEISADNGLQIYIPDGFAHGFCTLEPDTVVVYKVSSYYAPGAEAGILWSDPQLKIDWPVTAKHAIISDKDAVLPLLNDLSLKF